MLSEVLLNAIKVEIKTNFERKISDLICNDFIYMIESYESTFIDLVTKLEKHDLPKAGTVTHLLDVTKIFRSNDADDKFGLQKFFAEVLHPSMIKIFQPGRDVDYKAQDNYIKGAYKTYLSDELIKELPQEFLDNPSSTDSKALLELLKYIDSLFNSHEREILKIVVQELLLNRRFMDRIEILNCDRMNVFLEALAKQVLENFKDNSEDNNALNNQQLQSPQPQRMEEHIDKNISQLKFKIESRRFIDFCNKILCTNDKDCKEFKALISDLKSFEEDYILWFFENLEYENIDIANIEILFNAVKDSKKISDTKYIFGKLIYSFANQREYKSIECILENQEVDLNVVTSDESVLFAVARNLIDNFDQGQEYDLIYSLIQCGADVGLKNGKNETLIEATKRYAIQRGTEKETLTNVVKVLRSYVLKQERQEAVRNKEQQPQPNSSAHLNQTGSAPTTVDLQDSGQLQTMKKFQQAAKQAATAGILSLGSYIKDMLPARISSEWGAFSNSILKVKGLETIVNGVTEYLGVSAKAANALKANFILTLPFTITIAAGKAVNNFMKAKKSRLGVLEATAESLYDTGTILAQSTAGVAGAAVGAALIGGGAAPLVASFGAVYGIGEIARHTKPVASKFASKIASEVSSKLGYSK